MFKGIILVFCLMFNLVVMAEVTSSDSYIDFSEVEVGDSDYIEVEIINEGDFKVRINRVDLNGDFSVFDLNESCFGYLEAGDSCYIEVEFRPDQMDDFYGQVEVYADDGSNLVIELFGEGI